MIGTLDDRTTVLISINSMVQYVIEVIYIYIYI